MLLTLTTSTHSGSTTAGHAMSSASTHGGSTTAGQVTSSASTQPRNDTMDPTAVARAACSACHDAVLPVTSDVASGDTLAISISASDISSGTPVTVDDSAGNTYRVALEIHSNHNRLTVFTALNVKSLTASPSDRITIHWGQNAEVQINADRLNGTHTIGPVTSQSSADHLTPIELSPPSEGAFFTDGMDSCPKGELIYLAIAGADGPPPAFDRGWQALPPSSPNSKQQWLATATRLTDTNDLCLVAAATPANYDAIAIRFH